VLKKVAAVVVALIAVGFGLANLNEGQLNAINPFAPKPPVGAFPETLAGQKRKGEIHYDDYRGIGYGYKFKTYYGEAPRQISYEVVDYGSAELARRGLSHGYLGGAGWVLATGGAREFASDSYQGGAVASQLAGQYVVRVAGEREAVVAFEQALPWGALGVPAWAPRTADEIEKPMPGLQLLDEFKAAPESAKMQLADKEFLFTGVVAAPALLRKGRAVMAFQKPGLPVGRDNTLAVEFAAGQESRVLALTKGQEVRFRGTVVFTEAVQLVIVREARMEEPTS
jgi:hypothetical protein